MNFRPPKTLLFLPLDDRTHVSGPVADALNIAQSFSNAKIPSIFIFNGQPELFRLFEQTGIDVRRMEMPSASVKTHFNPRSRRRYSRLLAEFIERENIELLYLLHDAAYLLIYVTNLGIPKVCSQIAGSPNPEPIRLFDHGVRLHPRHLIKAWYRKYVRLNHRRADLVVCLSGAARDTALITYGVEPERAVAVYPGVTGRKGESTQGEIRREFGIAEREQIVLSVGRITRAKGVEDFGEIARMMCERGKNYRFLFAGHERDEAYGRKIKKKYGQFVTFIGHRTDLANAYADADLYVHTSHRESGPLTIIEAMEFEVPSIAWDIPGCDELIVDGQTGSLINFGDLTSMADAIEKLLDDPAEYQKASAAALKRFDRYSVDDYAPRIMRAVRDRLPELVGSHAPI